MTREEAIQKIEDAIKHAYPPPNLIPVEVVEAFMILNKDYEQFLSWGARLKDLLEHPAVQKHRSIDNPRCVFDILKDTLDEKLEG